LTNDFFWLLVEQLEAEAENVENSVAFDYRIAQILDEAEFGIRPAFPPTFLSARPITMVSDAIKESVEEIRASILETPVIGNYASTNMVKSFLNDEEVIIHGAKMRGISLSSRFLRNLLVPVPRTCLCLSRTGTRATHGTFSQAWTSPVIHLSRSSYWPTTQPIQAN